MSHARRTRVIIILVIIAVGGGVFWHKVIDEQLFPKNFGVVEEGAIYRSGQLTPRMMRQMIEEHGLRTVVALNTDEPDATLEAEICAELGVDRIVLPMIGDGTGDPAVVAAAVRAISDPALQPLLVHCAAGAQRTTTVVLLYQHLLQGAPLADVYPDSFDYRHKPDEWILLAWVAENLNAVRDELAANAASGVSATDADAGVPPAP